MSQEINFLSIHKRVDSGWIEVPTWEILEERSEGPASVDYFIGVSVSCFVTAPPFGSITNQAESWYFLKANELVAYWDSEYVRSCEVRPEWLDHAEVPDFETVFLGPGS